MRKSSSRGIQVSYHPKQLFPMLNLTLLLHRLICPNGPFISLTGVSLNVVVDDLLPAVGEVDVVDALGVVALALLLVPEGRTVVPAIHLVPEPVVRRAATFRCVFKSEGVSKQSKEMLTDTSGKTECFGNVCTLLKGSKVCAHSLPGHSCHPALCTSEYLSLSTAGHRWNLAPCVSSGSGLS